MVLRERIVFTDVVPMEIFEYFSHLVRELQGPSLGTITCWEMLELEQKRTKGSDSALVFKYSKLFE